MELIQRTVSLGLKRTRRESDKLSTSSAEAKNGGAISAPFHTSSWRCAQLSTGTTARVNYVALAVQVSLFPFSGAFLNQPTRRLILEASGAFIKLHSAN
jgi:hypothetical protein